MVKWYCFSYLLDVGDGDQTFYDFHMGVPYMGGTPKSSIFLCFFSMKYIIQLLGYPHDFDGNRPKNSTSGGENLQPGGMCQGQPTGKGDCVLTAVGVSKKVAWPWEGWEVHDSKL